MKYLERPKQLAALLPALFLLFCVALLAWPQQPPPSFFLNLAISRLAGALEADYQNGIPIPRNIGAYYASVAGSGFRCLEGTARLNVAFPRSALLQDITVTIEDEGDGFTINAEGDVHTRRWLLFGSSSHVCTTQTVSVRNVGCRTEALLISVGRGRDHWVRSLYRASNFIDMQPDPVPSLSFDMPTNSEELDKYWRWLGKIVGSLDRLQDDWGHRIRLEIDQRPAVPLLISSSAGPDGRWGTPDDMILKRDAETGVVLEKTGFGK